MKKSILTIVSGLLLTVTVIAQNPLPNPGFEDWESIDGNYEEPVTWSSANECSTTLGIYSSAKSTDAYSGTYSARMVTQDALFSTIKINGIITTSKMNCDPLNPGILSGIAYSERPDSIVGWFKYTPVGTDNAYIQVMLLDSTTSPVDTIGYVKHEIANTVTVWTRFSAAIAYSSMDDPNLSSVLFSSSWGNGNNNEGFNGSEFLIDDVEFIFNPTGINDPINASAWSVYPNPVVDLLYIKGETGKQAYLEVLDITGKRVMYTKINGETTTVDFGGFTPGVYLYQLRSLDSSLIRTGKLMVNP